MRIGTRGGDYTGCWDYLFVYLQKKQRIESIKYNISKSTVDFQLDIFIVSDSDTKYP